MAAGNIAVSMTKRVMYVAASFNAWRSESRPAILFVLISFCSTFMKDFYFCLDDFVKVKFAIRCFKKILVLFISRWILLLIFNMFKLVGGIIDVVCREDVFANADLRFF